MNPLRHQLVIAGLPIADIELPRQVGKLYDLAYNLWWTWNRPARTLFASVDEATWALYRNPVQLLINVEPTHWQTPLGSETFLRHYREVIAAFETYMNAPETWFERRFPGHVGGPIAYFSMEYGVHHSLALYSGGLGVLSGDHCKSASDLGLPFVAVGLLYRHGYFRQTVDADGRQQHMYPEYDFARLPVRPAAGHTGREVLVKVPFPERDVFVKVWVAQVGRVPLLLLDTDVPLNDPADRPIANLLYVRGREMRLAQEMVFGIGGVRALRALGLEPSVWHMNEGHSAILQLERMRELKEAGHSLEHARDIVARDAVFTTHTPVPAGNEQFDPELVRRYLAPLANELGLPADDILALGDSGAGGPSAFNLTALALRTTSYRNGVSKLNAEIAGDMWRQLFAASPSEELVIEPITNGVHIQTWVGEDIIEQLARILGNGWPERNFSREEFLQAMEILPDEAIWAAHQSQSARLGRFLRSRLREQFARHGSSPEELRAVEELFHEDTLTIGFARRFATYKRASLIFSDLDRLERLLCHGERPVQFLFAGKAHPADRPGQELIQKIFQMSQEPRFRGRVFFIEDYDMRVGAMMVQGVDVWLNNPRRPLEASGTSGQKAAMNGALNLSVLDGWWPEGYDGENGFVVGAPRDYSDNAEQDRDDAESLYHTLETQVIPVYYARDAQGLPRRWIKMMKRAIATVTPGFSSARMVRDYAEQAYLPAAARGRGEARDEAVLSLSRS
jgi:glycogen phosphorylase